MVYRLLCGAVFCCGLALGQATSTAGDVRGVVLDGTGSAIAEARVTLVDAERGFTRSVVSNRTGEFAIPLVPPGSYRMRVEASGFGTKVLEGLEVRVGDVVARNVELAPSAVATEVIVAAEAAAVEVERTQQSNTVEQRAIAALPINRRNFLDFAVLAPGVVSTQTLADDTSFRPIQTPNSGLSFGGSNGRGNGFFIDGLENFVISGGVRPTISQEAAQEFQINRNSFSAEFGNASGGVINIISKSGTNTWKGNAFGFLRHRDLQARNYFDPGKSAFTRSQAGATAGGAIQRNKQFLFLAFEHLSRQETNFIPILQDRSVFNRLPQGQADLLNVLEASGSPQLVGLARQGRSLLVPGNNPRVSKLFTDNSGNFPFSERNDQASGKYDVRFSEKHSAFLRVNFTQNPSNNNAFGALDGFNRGRSVNQTDLTGALSDTYLLNTRWIMESRAQIGYNRLKVLPNDPNGPEININGFGFFGRQIFVPYRNIERHYEALQNYSYLSGRHSVKFGWDINPVRVGQQSDTFLGGRFTFGSRIPLGLVLQGATGDPNIATTLAGVLAGAGQQRLIPVLSQPITALQSYSLGIPELYQQGFGDPNYRITTTRYNFFVQDTWKVNSHLTLNGGLRYELERHNPIVPRDYNNIGPRVGFAWSPGSSQKTVVRGGYGLYYAPINGQVAGVAEPLSGKYINQVLLTPTSTIFRDPRTQQFVTSATVFQTLTAQGVIGKRQISEADLAQFGVRVGPNLPGSVVFGIEPDFQNPWAHQASFEVERQIGGFAVSLGYNFNRAAHITRNTGRNVAYSGQRLPDGRPTFVRPNPLLLQVNNAISDANSFYHAGILQVSRRFSHGFSFNFSQTFSKAMDESTDFNSDYSPQDQLNFRAERALSSFHQKHRTVLHAVYQSQAKRALLKDWSVAPIFIYSSARPFNVLTGVDNQGDTYVNNKRPATLGRNVGQGPDYASADLRVSRRFQLGRRENQSVEILAEGFNLLNRTNFRTVNNIVGDVPPSTLPNPIVGTRASASTPLAYTSALEARQFQLGVKLYW